MIMASRLLLLFVTLLSNTAVEALWPQPRYIMTGSQALRLHEGFTITVTSNPCPDLSAAIQRTTDYLRTDRLGRLVVGRGSADASVIKDAAQLRTMTVTLGLGAKTIAKGATAPLERRDESYALLVPADGSPAILTANSALGVYRGLTTFSQLWYTHQQDIYALDLPITIEDSPVYPYRGLMLDTARNFFPIDVIKRQLDAMSWVKINTLHWHVVDSQSFPLVVPAFESLAEKGAYSFDQTYSSRDVADVVTYAAERGIDVLVEIDTPGHTSVISKAFPEHIACPDMTPWATYANEPPAGQLRLASAQTTKFTTDLLTSVADMFPGNYISTGGDEINMNCYNQDLQTQQDLNSSGKTFEQALDAFTQAEHSALRGKGKTPVVWEEMILTHNLTLAKDTIAMVWISSENAAAVAADGFRIVHSPSDYFYLDCGAGAWVGNATLANSWCDPFKTWQKAYSFDPLAGLIPEQYKLVLGGQHLLWTEQSSPNNIDSIVWPRAAASAEVFWSGPGGNSDTALPRLHDIAFRMKQRGVNAIALQPMWCALRPGVCDLPA